MIHVYLDPLDFRNPRPGEFLPMTPPFEEYQLTAADWREMRRQTQELVHKLLELVDDYTLRILLLDISIERNKPHDR